MKHSSIIVLYLVSLVFMVTYQVQVQQLLAQQSSYSEDTIDAEKGIADVAAAQEQLTKQLKVFFKYYNNTPMMRKFIDKTLKKLKLSAVKDFIHQQVRYVPPEEQQAAAAQLADTLDELIWAEIFANAEEYGVPNDQIPTKFITALANIEATKDDDDDDGDDDKVDDSAEEDANNIPEIPEASQTS